MFQQEHPTVIIILSVQLRGNPSVFMFAIDHNVVISNCSGRSSVTSGIPGGGFSNPPPEIPKALQNHAKLNPIVKTVKNC